MRVSSLTFFPFAYGLYILGIYAQKSISIYKGVAEPSVPIPISITFFFILMGTIFVSEIIITILSAVMRSE